MAEAWGATGEGEGAAAAGVGGVGGGGGSGPGGTAPAGALPGAPDDEVAPDIAHYDLDGVPLFHLPLPTRSTAITLTFGTGRADEPAHRTGMTHLAEHLVMGDLGDFALDGNGQTAPYETSFSLMGTPAEAERFLAELGRAIGDPPLARIREERTVLETEEGHRGEAGLAVRAAWLRYGCTGLGGLMLPELFVRDPDPQVLRAWMAEHFVRGNAALWVAGVLPAGLRLAIPDGPKYRRAPAQPIDGFQAPTFAMEDAEGVAAGMLVPRTAAMSAALHIAERRFQRAVRIERSLGYVVDVSYLPMDATTAHATVLATCQPNRVSEVEGLLLTTLDELALRGPTEAELALNRDRSRRAMVEPFSVPSRLGATVRDYLLDTPLRTVAEDEAERAAIDADAVKASMATALETMLLLAPRTGFEPNRRRFPYPGPTPVTIAGTWSFPAVAQKRWPWERPPVNRLVMGAAGVAIHDARGRRLSAVAWDDCVAYVQEADGRRVYSRDGWMLGLAASAWERGEEAMGQLDRLAPREVLVGPRT